MDVHIEFHNADKSQAEELFRSFYSPSASEKGDKLDSEEDVSLHAHGSEETAPLHGDEKSSLETPSAAPPRGTTLPRNVACTLARQFSAAIPDRELSVAALQGYLMTYKTRPLDAVRNAPGWVAQTLAERRSKET